MLSQALLRPLRSPRESGAFDPARIRVFQAPWVLPIEGAPIRDGAVVFDVRGPVLDIGPGPEVAARWKAYHRVELPGILLPGFVDAYARLELEVSEREGRIGLRRWVRKARELRRATEDLDPQSREARVRASVVDSVAAGTVAVGEWTRSLRAVPAMARVGLHGVAFHEVPGVRESARRAAKVLAAAAIQKAGIVPWPDGVRYRLAPEEVVRGVGLAALEIAGRAGESLLDPRSLREAILGAKPRFFVVAGDVERASVASAVADRRPLVLAPRQHQGHEGRLPPWVMMLEMGANLALGTAGAGGAGARSVLREAAELHAFNPEVPSLVLLRAATRGGAEALGIDSLGALAPGLSPGLLHAGTYGATPRDPAGFLLRHPDVDLSCLVRAGAPSMAA